jgi:hypothetical protein
MLSAILMMVRVGRAVRIALGAEDFESSAPRR